MYQVHSCLRYHDAERGPSSAGRIIRDPVRRYSEKEQRDKANPYGSVLVVIDRPTKEEYFQISEALLGNKNWEGRQRCILCPEGYTTLMHQFLNFQRQLPE